jgi:uncharacterized protein YoxC
MTAVDGVYWALALAIVIIAAALTWLLVRCAGTVGRVNLILGDVRREVPAASASVRRVLENAEQVTADAAAATSVLRDAAATVRLLVDRVQEAVRFLDQNVFSKLAVLAPFFVAVGSWLDRLVSSRRKIGAEDAGTPEEDTAP